jgi:hypothetical protein
MNDSSQTASNSDLFDLSADYDFIAPNEICATAIGLLFSLISRRTIDVTFSKLYQQR